mgnify:CR=1 FL=1
MGHNSVDYVHVVTEAMKMAYADRDSIRRQFDIGMQFNGFAVERGHATAGIRQPRLVDLGQSCFVALQEFQAELLRKAVRAVVRRVVGRRALPVVDEGVGLEVIDVAGELAAASGVALLIAATIASSSCGTSFGEVAFDAAYVASQASEVKACRDAYEQTGDRFLLQSCEADIWGR